MVVTRLAPPPTNRTGAPRRPVARKLAWAIALACALGANAAWSSDVLPSGASQAAGSINAPVVSGSNMTINVNTPKAVINWNTFSVGSVNTVQFVQPGASSVVLNRVTGGVASNIDGNLQANGQLFLVNPNGVFFGATSHVDVGGLVASSLDIADNDFMSGSYLFAKSGGSPLGQVVNNGSINIASGGYAALLGEQVVNGATGVISAPAGRIGMGVGEQVTITFDSNQLLSFSVGLPALNNLAYAQNSGQLLADGGRVSMTAMVSNALASAVVNQSGLIRAQGVADKNGEVYLSADGGNIEVSGSIEVGAQSAAPPSTLNLSANNGNISVTNTGSLAASGSNGANLFVVASGGQVSLGGSISAQSDAGATNIGMQGTSVALNSASISSTGFLSASMAMYASNGGITQSSNGVISAATTASVQEATDAGGYASANVNLISTGAQDLGGAITTTAHGPQAASFVSASSSTDAVSVNQVSVRADGGGNYANLSLSAAGNITSTGNLSTFADAGPATSIIAAGGAVQLGGNLSVQGVSASNSATLATITAGNGDVRMAPGTQISVIDTATGSSAGAGLSVDAPQGQLVLGDINVASVAGPAQTLLHGAGGVTFAGNVGTSGNSAQINVSADGAAVVVNAGQTVQATATDGGAQLNISTPGGSLQIDGSLQTHAPGASGRITTDPASPWDTPGPVLQLAFDADQAILTRLLTIARTTPSNPLAGNGLIVMPSWNIVGLSPLANGSIDAALYEDDGQEGIVPTSEIKGDGAPINAAMRK